jgi:tyrosine-protein phosphatase SIW14
MQRIWRTAQLLFYTVGVLFIGAHPGYAAVPSRAAAVESAQGIPNLGTVADNFYRGGQPTAEALQSLKAAGVAVDVCLDNEQRYINDERGQAAAAGLKFINIPLNPLRRPSEADIARFLSIVNRKDEEPVFVHCVHGRDRTGAMVAIYRQVHDHWSPDAAYREMLDHGFRPFFKKLSDTVFDIGERMGMSGHRPSIGFIATHLSGNLAEEAND